MAIQKEYSKGVMGVNAGGTKVGGGPSSGLQIVSALSDLVKGVAPAIDTYAKEKADRDQVEQTRRAFAGEEMSNDATVAGATAYKMVGAQKAISDAIARRAQDMTDRANSEAGPMSDEERKMYDENMYSSLQEQFRDVDGDSERMVSRFLNLKMQEAQPGILAFDQKLGQQVEQRARVETFRGHLDSLDGMPPDAIGPQIDKMASTAQALGLDKDAAFEAVKNKAKVRAGMGDPALAIALEQHPQYRDDPDIRKIRQQGEMQKLQNDADEVGRGFADLTGRIDAGQADERTVAQFVQDTRLKYGVNSLTSDKIQYLYNQVAAARNKVDKLADATAILAPLEGRERLDTFSGATPEQRKLYRDAKNEWFAQRFNAVRDDPEARVKLMMEASAYAQSTGFKIDMVQDAVEQANALLSGNFPDGKLPSNTAEALRVVAAIPPQELIVGQGYTADQVARLSALNDLSARFGLDKALAMYRDNATKPAVQLGSDKDTLTMMMDHLSTFDKRLKYGDSIDDQDRANWASEMMPIFKSVRSGFVNDKQAMKIAFETVAGRKTRLGNQAFIDLSPKQLGEAGFNSTTFSESVEDYIKTNAESWIKEDPSIGEIKFDRTIQFRVDGSLVQPLKDGMPIGSPVLMADLKRRHDNLMFERSQQSSKSARYQNAGRFKMGTMGPQAGMVIGLPGQQQVYVDSGDGRPGFKNLPDGTDPIQFAEAFSVPSGGASKDIAQPEFFPKFFDALMFGETSVGEKDPKTGKIITPQDVATVKSSAGAIGPAQLMPIGAKEAYRLSGEPYSDKWKTDAEENQRLGQVLLKAKLAKYGDARLALVAYNWGPTALDRKMNELRKKGIHPSFEAVYPHLPKESKGHVKKIMKRYQGG